MKRHLNTVGKISEYFIYGFLLFVLFVILSPRLPTKNFLTSYIVPTGSMYPTVKSGSVVFVNPTDKESHVGDVIAFTSPFNSYETVLHRVVTVTDKGITTKGDNNNSADTWIVEKKDVKGKLILSIPYLGHVAAFVRKPVGFVILALIPASLLALNFLFDIKNGLKEEIEKKKQKKTNSKIVILFIVFFTLGFRISTLKATSVFAAFSAQASIQGIAFATVSIPTPSPSPSPRPHHDDDDSHEHNDGCRDIDFKVEHERHDRGDSDDDWDNTINSHVYLECRDNHTYLHFHKVKGHRITYQFEYDSDEGHQGIRGEIHKDNDDDITRDMYTGSCSGNDCRENKNIRHKAVRIKFRDDD